MKTYDVPKVSHWVIGSCRAGSVPPCNVDEIVKLETLTELDSFANEHNVDIGEVAREWKSKVWRGSRRAPYTHFAARVSSPDYVCLIPVGHFDDGIVVTADDGDVTTYYYAIERSDESAFNAEVRLDDLAHEFSEGISPTEWVEQRRWYSEEELESTFRTTYEELCCDYAEIE